MISPTIDEGELMRLSYLLLALTLSSCTIAIKTPGNRFISPETKGKLFDGDVAISYRGYTRSNLDTSGVSAGSKINNALKNESSQALAAQGSLGFLDNLDIYIVAPDRSPIQAGLKFQILGEPENKAKKGNHSLAVTMSYGRQTDSNDSDSDIFDVGVSADVKSRVRDASVIYGYRMGDWSLVYSGISYSNYDFDGVITSSNYLNAHFEYDTNVLGAHVGVMGMNERAFVKIEAALQKTDWTHTQDNTYGLMGLQLGTKW